MLRKALLALFTVGLTTGTWGAVDSGMVLLFHQVPEGYRQGGVIELKYLSTGRTIVLQNGSSAHAHFSPDGRGIGFTDLTLSSNHRWIRSTFTTMNLDGTDKNALHEENNSNGVPCFWASDGNVYVLHFQGNGRPYQLYAIPENGGDAVVAHTFSSAVPTPRPENDSVAFGPGMFSMSLDGQKLVCTGQHYQADGTKSGWSQFATDLSIPRDFSPWSPCQGSISPDGERLSVANGGHRSYRIARWPVTPPFETFGPDGAWGNTWSGCRYGPSDNPYSDGLCPGYDTVLNIGDDLKRMYNLDQSPELSGSRSTPAWSRTDTNIFMFCLDPKYANYEEAGGAWLIDLAASEYTKVAPNGYIPLDYCRTEYTPPSKPFLLTPEYTLFYLDSSGTSAGTKSVTLSSAEDMSSAPTLSGVPDWLRVTPVRVSAREYTLECTLVTAGLPDTAGNYPDTLQVTPGGSVEPLSMRVALYLEDQPERTITITNPGAGQQYHIGDTLRVEYSADSTVIAGTLISLSTDAGDTWTQMHDDASWETGSNKVLEYVIPSSIDGQSPVSTQCLVVISNYPSGYETYSGVFSIVAATQAHSRPPIATHATLRASVKHSASVTILTITSSGEGTARLIDLHGRTVRSFELSGGTKHVRVPSLRAGRYLLETTYTSGARATIAVNAL